MSENELLLKVAGRITDLTGLPPEVLKEIQSIKKARKGYYNNKIVYVIREDLSGMANVDEILVALYRRFQVVIKRAKLLNILHYMAKKKFLTRLTGAGTQGVYSITANLKR